MRFSTSLAALFLSTLAVLPASAQVGGPLPDTSKVKDFTQTPARSFDDYVGRLVLVEFFAYW